MTTNIPHGYHRDYQLLKEVLFPAIETLKELLSMSCFMLEHVSVNKNILADAKYDYLFTVEEVNNRVLSGKTFRDAYIEVGQEVQNNQFVSNKQVNHTHQGSIGSLCTREIKEKMKRVVEMFS